MTEVKAKIELSKKEIFQITDKIKKEGYLGEHIGKLGNKVIITKAKYEEQAGINIETMPSIIILEIEGKKINTGKDYFEELDNEHIKQLYWAGVLNLTTEQENKYLDIIKGTKK